MNLLEFAARLLPEGKKQPGEEQEKNETPCEVTGKVRSVYRDCGRKENKKHC